MRTFRLILAAATVAVTFASAGCAERSGGGTVVCTAAAIYRCDRMQSCTAVSDSARFTVDLRKRVLIPADAGADVSRPVQNVAALGHLLFAQGIIADETDNGALGAGWSLSLNNDTGVMTVSGVLDGAAIVLTGTCVPMLSDG